MVNRLKGVFGVVLGIVITAASIIAMWVLMPRLWTAIHDIPGVGPDILDFLQVLEFPGDRVFLPLLGIYIIFWGIALAMQKSWARLMAAVINGVLGVYVLTILALVVPLRAQFTDQYRWLILAVGLLLAGWFAYQVYTFLSPRTEEEYARKWQGKAVVTICDRCQQPLDRRGQCPHCEPVSPRPAAASPPQARQAAQAGPGAAGAAAGGRGSAPAAAGRPAAPRAPAPAPQYEAAPTRRQVLAALVAADGTRHEITRAETVVGRDAACDVVVPDSSASRQHAVLTFQDGRFTLRDQDSTNGTFVNGERLAPSVELRSGDQVMIGRVAMVFESALPGDED